MSRIEDIASDFELLDDWEDRYRYIIELGKDLAPLSDAEHSDANKVSGCVSQVWLVTEVGDGPNPLLNFRADSDAHIVRGLVAIVVTLFSGKTAQDILALDAMGFLDRLGLHEHLSPQRANGLSAMVERIRAEALAIGAAY